MEINELTKQIHENAVEHGWWDEKRSFGEIVALCHSELSEALEEDRAGRPYVWHECKESNGAVCEECIDCYYNLEGIDCGYKGEKLEGIATEMADCIIRILDWFGYVGIDAEKLILDKHNYNKTRPYKHGKRY